MLGNNIKEKGIMVAYFKLDNMIFPSSSFRGIQKYEPKDQTGENVFYNVFIDFPAYTNKNADGYSQYAPRLMRSKLFAAQFTNPDLAYQLDELFEEFFASVICDSVMVNLNTLVEAILHSACKKGIIKAID